MSAAPTPRRAGLGDVAREWTRIGCTGFGGPPAHVALLRRLCVERRGWMTPGRFEDALAACNLLPGPASTQLSIFCGWHVAGRAGAVIGGLCFILPGLVAILALGALFLSGPPEWVRAAGAGAGAAVAAVAVHAGWGLVPSSVARAASRRRWAAYLLAGGAAAVLLGPWLVAVLLACGLAETAARGSAAPAGLAAFAPLPLAAAAGAAGGVGGVGALTWTSLKVGALAYGGGFVIIPLMQADAVDHHGWMSGARFLDAVALGQVTPGPVTHTVAVVGYAAFGLAGGLLAAAVAFAPSFVFVLAGAGRFDRLRGDRRAQAFLGGAGPAAVGAILGSAYLLAGALGEPWQFAVLAGAGALLLVARRGVVTTLVAAGVAGVVAVLVAGLPVPA